MLSENLSFSLGIRIGLGGLSMVVADDAASATGGVMPAGEAADAVTGASEF
jgi:hypothetical protein